ncbi:hypothetical protein MTF66_29035 [Pseudoalteromonas sp. 2CM39R]|uniref:hypothetical protein n=1 Tax=Pseudoalteromonas sp. 2CM39R TaxID=2929856 RepID=UPI0020BF6D36|nr:hypothetical protein [Pseudoalteromonas sp. 2CM39R]MCK8129090.1 hypothetical protein [Pseudoalteromonas sp. 2CM39R]
MLDKMLNILLNEDELGAVVRAHILIEQYVDHFLSLVVPNHDYLNKMSIDFSNKVKLAVAMGLDEEIYKPINSITSIRNKFAHRANFKLDSSDVKNFYDSFVAEDRDGIQAIISNNPDRPTGLADKYSRLSIKEKLVVMVILLAIRIESEVKFELDYVLEQIDDSEDEVDA